MLCKPDLDLFEMMSCFEVMDAKMDQRMHRKEVLTPAKARLNGVLVPASQLTAAKKHALLQELIVQFCTWQD